MERFWPTSKGLAQTDAGKASQFARAIIGVTSSAKIPGDRLFHGGSISSHKTGHSAAFGERYFRGGIEGVDYKFNAKRLFKP